MRAIATLLMLLLSSAPALAQQYSGQKSFTTTSAAADSAVRLVGTSTAWHKLVWTKSGTVSTCTVGVDASADGVTWGSADVVGLQDCTANGEAALVNVVASYVRLRVAAITGGGSVTAVWTGYVNAPTVVTTVVTNTFATGTAGADFNVVPGSALTTFNLPDASATARGALTPQAQVIGGNKTFTKSLVINDTLDVNGASSQAQSNISDVVFTGSGLNDCSFAGTYIGDDSLTFTAKIDGTGTPDTISWGNNVDANDGGTGVALTTSPTQLSNGITFQCSATTGHTSANSWSVVASEVAPLTLLNSSGVAVYTCHNSGYGCSGSTVVPPAAPQNGLVAGGSVSWAGGLLFVVQAADYVIAGQTYHSPQTTVTLDAAPTGGGAQDRIDLIVVNASGAATFVKGTEGTPPAAPTVDPSTTLSLTFAYIAVDATAPSNVSTDAQYLENTEWTCAYSSAAGNCAAAVAGGAYAGTKYIQVTNGARTSYLTLTRSAPVAPSAYNNEVFYIKSGGVLPATRSLLLQFYSGATRLGNGVTLAEGSFGFRSANTTSYQQIAIPVTNFGIASGVTATILRVTLAGSGTQTYSFALDNVSLQGGVPPPSLPSNIMIWRGAWNATASYKVNDVVTNSGVTYLALLDNTNVTPAAGATWAALSSTAAPTTQPYDVPMFLPGILTASMTARIVVPRAVTFPTSLTGSYGKSVGVAAAEAVFSIQKNGVEFGTCTFAVGAATCTFASASGAVFAAGDIYGVVAPVTPDATLSDVSITTVGTRAL